MRIELSLEIVVGGKAIRHYRGGRMRILPENLLEVFPGYALDMERSHVTIALYDCENLLLFRVGLNAGDLRSLSSNISFVSFDYSEHFLFVLK